MPDASKWTNSLLQDIKPVGLVIIKIAMPDCPCILFWQTDMVICS